MIPLRQRYALDFEWRGFELHPATPAGGLDLASLYPADRLAAGHARLAEVAAGFGLPFTARPRMPCTRPALAIAELARRNGRLDAWRTGAMEAHWVDGRDIEDRAVLGDLAAKAGLDPAEALAFLDAPEVAGLLTAQRALARKWGVTGIPTWFILPDGWHEGDPMPTSGPRPVRVVGCQPMDVVEGAAHAAGAEPA